MIARLRLINFGKFRGRDLELGPFTIIHGANEAGKTTVFDAIFESLCRRNDTKSAWKRLLERYGDERQAAAVWQPEDAKPALDDAEFLEIFAIRGGEASVRALSGDKGGSAWSAAAENALLNAGLNPARLADALSAMTTSNAKESFNARLKKLKSQSAESTARLEELETKRSAIFEAERQSAELERQIAAGRTELDAANKKLADLKAKVEELSGACRLKDALEGLKALRELKEARESLEIRKDFARNEIGAYRALKERENEATGRALAAAAALRGKEEAAAALKKAVADLEAREAALRRRRETAESLKAKLAAYASGPDQIVLVSHMPTRAAVWFAGAALAAFVAWSGGNTAGYIASAFIFAGAAWAGVKISMKPMLAGHRPEEVAEFIAGLAAEWKAGTGETMAAVKLEEVRTFFSDAEAAHKSAAESVAARKAEVAPADGVVTAANEELRDRDAEAKSLAGKAAEWLRARGCASENDYQDKAAEYIALAGKAESLTQRAGLMRQRMGAAAEEDLKDRLFDEKEALERKGFDPEKADHKELERLEKRAAAAAEDAQARDRALLGLGSQLEVARATAGAKLEGLPEEIGRLRNELEAAAEESADIDLRKEACLLAAGVFEKIAESSSAAFTQLGKEVTEALAGALPSAAAEFTDFDSASASMTDAGGTKRPIDQLSAGTRDLFMLAARVALARRARKDGDGPALLVLDEPFFTLDPERLRAALRLVAAFHKSSGWQVIILTKDPAIQNEAALIDGLHPKTIDL
ncbi:MAG: AAA family ATPase [Elusimicrobiales bacterium]|nr:AAA family ATPase [Elusimicrobiales bacterium]